MDRREFLNKLGVASVLTAAWAAGAGCSSSSTSSTPADGFTVTSAPASIPGGYAHTHGVRVLFADLSDPPAGGVTYTTSLSEGHTHRLTLSLADLVEIQAGGTTEETTTFDSGHSHAISIRKP